jgi:diadenosine tetraphosphate (Ap4A) HIT family hydrolase
VDITAGGADDALRSAVVTLPEYSSRVLAGIRAAEVDGRLPPPSAEALGPDVFPFEGALAVRPFRDPELPEPARAGEAGRPCPNCTLPDDAYLWTNARWRIRALPEPFGVHAIFLEPREHLELGDLDADLAAELGVLIVRVEQVLSHVLDGVGRVHVNRWGDGGAHLHWWFIARPAGLTQLRGSSLTVWLEVLPPLAEDDWRADLQAIAAALAAAEPPAAR